MHHHKDNSFIVAIIFGAAVLASVTSFFVQNRHYIESAIEEQVTQGIQTARTISLQVIEPIRSAAWAVAGSLFVFETATGKRPVDDHETMLMLETTKSNFNASLVYVMDLKGVVVACTPYGEGKTLTGKSYSFRPYFTEAMKGQAALYPALGVTTYERGIYVSAPIYGRGPDPQGVLVVKCGLDIVEEILLQFKEPMALASPEGIIFAANRPHWLYCLSRPSINAEVIERVRQSQQFADKPLDPLAGALDLSSDIVKLMDKKYSIFRTPVGIVESGGKSWELITLMEFESAYKKASVYAVSAGVGVIILLMGLYLADRRIKIALRKEAAAGSEYLATTLDSIAEAVLAFDVSGRLKHLNPAAEKLLGRIMPEIRGMPAKEVFRPQHEAGLIEIQESIVAALRGGDSEVTRAQYFRLENQAGIHDVIFSVSAIKNEDGRIDGAVMVLSDITLLKEAEDALRRERERFSILLDGNPIPTFVIDCEHKVVLWNRACESISGFAKPDVLGRVLDSTIFYPPPRRPVLADLVLDMNETGIADLYREKGIAASTLMAEAYEASDKLKIAGVERDFYFLAARCRDSKGEIIGAIETLQDITERKRIENERLELERRLFHAQKAESLSRMAGAVAHHFNNMLAAVIGNLELSMLELSNNEDATRSLNEAFKATRKAADMGRLMLIYLGQGITERKPLDLSALCREASPLIEAAFAQSIIFARELPEHGPIIIADEADIRRLIINLTTNAAEALSGKEGTVKIAISTACPSNEKETQHFPVEWIPKDSRYACIVVSDDGEGMDNETLDKIFDPFFSTKFTGRGLGLAVTLGIVKAMEGAIEVESSPGKGSLFRVFLPMEQGGYDQSNGWGFSAVLTRKPQQVYKTKIHNSVTA